MVLKTKAMNSRFGYCFPNFFVDFIPESPNNRVQPSEFGPAPNCLPTLVPRITVIQNFLVRRLHRLNAGNFPGKVGKESEKDG